MGEPPTLDPISSPRWFKTREAMANSACGLHTKAMASLMQAAVDLVC